MATLKVPDVVPSPAEDSETLKNAFRGIGTDEKAIITILGHRNAKQRKAIRETYHQLYKESLIDSLKSELSGDFRTAVILWTSDPAERDAKLANKALNYKKKGIKELQVLVEIACASSPNHLVAVRQSYRTLYHCSLEEDIEASVAQPLKKFLVGLVSAYRYDKEKVDPKIASLEAEKLHEAISTKRLNQDHIIWMLCTRNFFQLRETFACYRQSFGNRIEQSIKESGKGDLETLLSIVMVCIDCPQKHFAKVVRDATYGLGTDEDSLTRAIVTRAEIDMARARTEYAFMYKSRLDDAVTGDTSGDYRRFLMALLGTDM